MARSKYYTKMKENVSPKNAAFELTNLKRLHKSQLINMLLQQNAKIKQLEQKNNNNNKKIIITQILRKTHLIFLTSKSSFSSPQRWLIYWKHFLVNIFMIVFEP